MFLYIDFMYFSLTLVLYLVLVQQPLVHDVVEVHEKVCVWGHILPPLHDSANQLVGVKFPLLVALRQHGCLGRKKEPNCSHRGFAQRFGQW